MENTCKNSGSPTDKNEFLINYFACRPIVSEQSHPPPLLPRLLDQHPVYSQYIVLLKHFCREIHLEMIITRTQRQVEKKGDYR